MKIKVSALLVFCLGVTVLQAQTVKDIDGNVYKTVTIGTQTWMAENLKTTKLNDGTAIPLATVEGNEWAEHTVGGLTTPEFGWLYDSAMIYKDKYGAFYNGYAVTIGNLCPSGWHVPSDEEWSVLITYLGGEAVAGGKLREPGTKHWNSPNNGATNETDFSARGGGGITDNGSNWSVGSNTTLWSSTNNDEGTLWGRLIYGNIPNIFRTFTNMHTGNSVRCVSDITEKTANLKASAQRDASKAVANPSKPKESVTIRNESFRFEISAPAGWLFSKIVQQDPYEEMKSGSYSSSDSGEGDKVPDNWNGFRLSSTDASEGPQPFLMIYGHEVSDQNREEFATLFKRFTSRFKGDALSANWAFSVGDAKGFDCTYGLGAKVRYTVLYRDGIRVVSMYYFPSSDPTDFDKYAPDVDNIIRSIQIK